MISLICGMYNMTDMKLSKKQKQTHSYREQACGCPREGVGEGWVGRLGLADTNYYYINSYL